MEWQLCPFLRDLCNYVFTSVCFFLCKQLVLLQTTAVIFFNKEQIFQGIWSALCLWSASTWWTIMSLKGMYNIGSRLWFLRIFLYKCSFASTFSWKKRSSHQGKKEVACIVSKPLVSCLLGMWRACKSSKIKHPGGSGGFVLKTKGRPRPAT